VNKPPHIARFAEWLPDLPPFGNPGLTEAENVIPADTTYNPYLPIAGVGTALAARPQGATAALDSSGNAFFYAGTATKLYVRASTAFTDKSGATTFTTASDGFWRFAQFDTTLVATNYADVPQAISVGSGGDFAVLAGTGTAPRARHVGVVNRFVVLGDTSDGTNGAVPNRLQWSAIDDATNWPTPGGATALSLQSGEQFLSADFGPVRSIVGGDQYGIVLQRSGVTRMTYIGGNVVFQFDTIEKNRGALFPNATVTVGRLVFFVASDGFYATDGVQVVPIGFNKVDNHFADSVDTDYLERMYGAVDFANKCIYWAYPSSSSASGLPNRVLIYNYEEKRWTRAEDEIEVLVTGLTSGISLDDIDDYYASLDDVVPSLDAQAWAGGNNLIVGFDSTNKYGLLSGSAGTGIIESAEMEAHPGLYTRIHGVKPLVTGSPTITVALGTRNSLSDSVTYTAETTPTSRTGFADFRNESRYARYRVTLTGSFDAAIGAELQATPGGAS
jgi:hypothetical protein